MGSFFSTLGTRFSECFSDFSVTDVIDILFLSVVLFLVFRFIKGRKAGVLLVGIFILLVITFVVSYFELKASSYVFIKIFEIGPIAIVIIFQQEIRDALEKVGFGSINGLIGLGEKNNKRQTYSTAIDHICSAVSELASKKTGALIVISRTTKLDDVINTGVTINAEVNSYLLRNLFFTNAPLHDGAVIIDDARIAAAGCVLPLTRRADIDTDLGTRHRAAIGMSESTDAIVIIVSEETGTVSVAYDCVLTRNYTADSLRKFLTQKMIKQNRDEKRGGNN